MKSKLADCIIYQVNLRSMASREPRNPVEAAQEAPTAGSVLAYLADNLSSIHDLGMTVLHLMPPFPIGVEGRKGMGSPYAARDYTRVEEEYGSMDELLAVVRRAHELEMKVILGMVPNHTSRDHTWVTEHPEYYVKTSDGKIAYDIDWTDTAKLDYQQPALRQAMYDVYDFWLSVLGTDEEGMPSGVDGFRIDMAHYINDLSFWNEALPQLKERHANRELLFLAECYGMHNNIDLFGRGINAAYDDDFYKCCQYLYGIERDGDSIILPGTEAVSNEHFRDKYEAFKTEGIAGAFEKALANYEHAFGNDTEAPCLARYTDNHDEGRGTYRFGAAAVRALNQLIFMSPHTMPFLLAGQEFGAENRPSIHERIQPCEKGRRILDDGRVTYEAGIEFEGNLFARGYEGRQAWYAFYKGIIQLRQATPALRYGSFKRVDVDEQCDHAERNIVAFEREWEGSVVRCAVNLGPDDRAMGTAALFEGDVIYGALQGAVLPAYSGIVSSV